MAALYKILILCVGFVLSCNLWAQSHLDPVSDSRELAERYGNSLLTYERKCGIVVEPSFSNRYGISLSTKCDSLTLIEKRPHSIVYLDSVNVREMSVVKVAIDSEFGTSLAELIDVAVEKSMPTFSAGLDGVMYYFFASNDSIGETWSPSDESSNCGVLVNIVEALKEAILTEETQVFIDEWWCSTDKLRLSFQNAPALPPFYFDKEFGNIDNNRPTIEYRASSPLTDDFQFNALMSCPTDYIEGTLSEDLTPIYWNNTTDSIFIDFCKALVKWQEQASVAYVNIVITVKDDEKESYDVKNSGKLVYLNFTVARDKLTIDNLIEQNNNCILRYMLENMMPHEAVRPAPKHSVKSREKGGKR
ncbi:hypothetical protein [uncultured Bacteroides sp.]|uniref:hypothetical protein n=1 Tax=uncultured Bacteroides sp. TaxID=162156 RepID=UPI00266FCEB9|nr:hypothetical protein [uncultured Bacteroides sp.]